jgi:hypothetical protein
MAGPSRRLTPMNDVLFFASVLTFSAAALLGYWRLLHAEGTRQEKPGLA